MRPERKEVLPLTPKPKEDGAKKNDAAKRLLEDVRRERPHPKLVEDVLAWSTLSQGVRPALEAKHGDHKFLVGQRHAVRGTPGVHGRERPCTEFL